VREEIIEVLIFKGFAIDQASAILERGRLAPLARDLLALRPM